MPHAKIRDCHVKNYGAILHLYDLNYDHRMRPSQISLHVHIVIALTNLSIWDTVAALTVRQPRRDFNPGAWHIVLLAACGHFELVAAPSLQSKLFLLSSLWLVDYSWSNRTAVVLVSTI